MSFRGSAGGHLVVEHVSDQGDTATTTLHSDVSWFRPIVDLNSDRVTLW